MKKYSALFWGRYYRPLLPILLLFVPSYGAAPRSYNINGIFYDKPEEMQVSPADIIDGESCFSGLGITNCKHIPQGWSLSDFNFDEYVGDAWAAPDLGSTPFHWTNVFADPNGNKLPFCIECCSNSRTNYYVNEEWNIVCSLQGVPGGRATREGEAFSAMYPENDKVDGNLCPGIDLGSGADPPQHEYWFQFARNHHQNDRGLSTCILKVPRNAPNASDTATWFYGYNLTLYVTEHNEGDNYWRGVDHCEAYALLAETDERCEAQIFNENIRVCVGDWEEFATAAGCDPHMECESDSDCEDCAKRPPEVGSDAQEWQWNAFEQEAFYDFWPSPSPAQGLDGVGTGTVQCVDKKCKRFVCPRTEESTCGEKELVVEGGRRLQPGWAACQDVNNEGSMVVVGVVLGALLTVAVAFRLFRWFRDKQYYKAKRKQFGAKVGRAIHAAATEPGDRNT